MQNDRCSGCGKTLEAGEDLVRIVVGSRSSGGRSFKEKNEWGQLHRSCFNRSIDSPEAVRDEIRRMQEERKVGARKAG
jgi:hypothetical protein